MFEIKLIICIKMDLELNSLQRLICHKAQTTNNHTAIAENIKARMLEKTMKSSMADHIERENNKIRIKDREKY